MTRRRVALTGIGLISPLGSDPAGAWDAVLSAENGVGPIDLIDVTALPVKFAGQARGFDPDRHIPFKDRKKMDRALQFAVDAGLEAWRDSGLEMDAVAAERVGVYVGSGVGGLQSIESTTLMLRDRGARRISPFTIPSMLINLASGHLSIRLGSLGPNFSHVSACATAGHSIGEAARLIRHGYADVMVAGGTEAAITPLAIAGFARAGALSTRNEDPAHASRPFDLERDGFVIAEGAGIVVLEDWDRARARGAHIRAEVLGYAANSDAHHITAPSPDGRGARRCMEMALLDAEVRPEQIDYVNAHGTSTPFNDSAETRALHEVFGPHARELVISSTKSMTGHALGAAGGLEAVFCTLALQTGVVPPTTNYEVPDPACDLDYCPNEARRIDPELVLSNAFGFGGTNACLVLRRVEATSAL